MCMPNASGAMGSGVSQEINMETQGEEQLRIMAQKQLKTNITMHELQSQRRQFTEAGRYKPVIQEIKGMMKLQEYEDIAKGDQRVETLRHCGLTDDEIRLQLGREGEEKGHDSVVLYLKNLSPRCSEHNLVSLFGRFQEGASQIVYRLMTGRMRGQAFVTFDSIDVAIQALQLINGFVLHGKPVIVQYGKRNTA